VLRWDWGFWGRQKQQLPPGDWFVWLLLAGRGFGKNRTATENIARMLRGPTPLMAPDGAPGLMTVVADNGDDLRRFSVMGPSGLLNVGPPEYRPA
jgi:phage terminase large subunit-like protein